MIRKGVVQLRPRGFFPQALSKNIYPASIFTIWHNKWIRKGKAANNKREVILIVLPGFKRFDSPQFQHTAVFSFAAGGNADGTAQPQRFNPHSGTASTAGRTTGKTSPSDSIERLSLLILQHMQSANIAYWWDLSFFRSAKKCFACSNSFGWMSG